jgi:hypothetical protein
MSQENVEIVRAQYASFGQLAESGELRGCAGAPGWKDVLAGRQVASREGRLVA